MGSNKFGHFEQSVKVGQCQQTTLVLWRCHYVRVVLSLLLKVFESLKLELYALGRHIFGYVHQNMKCRSRSANNTTIA